MLWIELPHDLPVIANQILHPVRISQEAVPAVFGEINRVVVLRAAAVIMKRTTVELPQRI